MDRESEVDRDAVPLILSGIVPEPMRLLESISHLGGVVIADDMACCGRRVYPAGESEDPFVRMAERILNASPDSTRGSPLQDRLEHLLRMAQASGARGIIFYLVKFCEPELFDIPRLRQGLLDAGIPSTTVEIDLNDSLANQALTRIEAFLEMVT
jgi:benzoyl-CoA reductase/2-hydroxyglutaryl-CoA dehydratase subunit BcrC/BadD/HgdB